MLRNKKQNNDREVQGGAEEIEEVEVPEQNVGFQSSAFYVGLRLVS